MEASSNISGLGGKEESKRDDSNGDHKEIIDITKIEDGIQVHQSNGSKSLSPKQESKKLAHRRSSSDTKLISSTQKDQDEQLESAKAEMGEVREENERLKTILARIVKDYQSLQMHYFDIVQQEKAKKSTEAIPITLQETEESELISLSLGMGSFEPRKDDKGGRPKEDEEMKEGLSLGLDCKFEGSKPNQAEPATNRSPADSYGETKDEEVGEQWPPSKILKTMRSGDDEVSQQPQVKKARVSVRARCDTPTMNDGCQWRKYGQKIAKGNPCPRAYYRCTVAPACPVRKQVQRCADDMSILITTYEGSHNHPLPMSATAMASTTSAAACMLMSGSTTSRQGLAVSATSTSTSVSDMNGMNFALSDSSRTRQFYLPNSSISSSPSYPTVTLDLTAPSSSSSSLQSQFTRLSSNFHPTQNYSSTNLNFSSSEPSTLPTSWSNAYLSYGPQSFKNHMGPLNLGRQPQEQFYTPYLQKNNSIPQASMTDTITAATKAITADPSFRSALAAAITSIVSGDGGAHENQPGGENFAQNLKWGEPIAPISTYSSTQNGNGCASTYLNRSSSSNPQQGSLMFLPPSVPFSTNNSASASPVDNRDNIN